MKLRVVDRSETGCAVALLSEGFEALSAATWEECVGKILAYSERYHDGAIGWIARSGERDIGICLGIPAVRTAYERASRKEVNLSAFYMRSGHQWMAALFLRRIMEGAGVDYVDLTPSSSMREINRRLGLNDRAAGMVVVPTVVAALRPSQNVQVIALSETPVRALSPDHRTILEEHEQLGCMSLVVEEDGAHFPLILAPTTRKGLPGQRVLLARDRAMVRAALGPLSRHLVRAGKLYVEYDDFSAEDIPEALFWRRAAPVQSTRETRGEAIDLTFSELAFLPPPEPLPHDYQTLAEHAERLMRRFPVTGRAAVLSDPTACLAITLADFAVLL